MTTTTASANTTKVKCFICLEGGNLKSANICCGPTVYHPACFSRYCSEFASVCPICKKNISDKLIVNMHDDLLINIDQRKGYRTKDVLVRGGGFSSTPWQFISSDVKELIKWYEENKKLHPLVLASLFHHKFEKIHPFFDGNGRTGRMLMNFILLKNNYPPIIIRKKYRTDYLDSLGVADKKNLFSKETKQYRKLVEFVVNELVENYWNTFL